MAALATGCFMSSSSSSGTSSGPASGGGYASSSGAGATGQPMLVVVDTGQKLTADGGLGVGVFTEYQAGGHWHVWWTCDSAQTGLDCHFQVNASVAKGTLGNVESQLASQGAQLTQPSAGQISATSTTSTLTDGVLFDTAPGATITLDARLDGADNGAFLFFVQDGMVNGGYKGILSDPLMLQPSAP